MDGTSSPVLVPTPAQLTSQRPPSHNVRIDSLGQFLKLEEFTPSSASTESEITPQLGSIAGEGHLEDVLVAPVILRNCVSQS